MKINPSMNNANKGIVIINKEIITRTNVFSLFSLFSFTLAFKRLYNEVTIKMKIVPVPNNMSFRFNSPVIFPKSSTKNIPVNAKIPHINEIINHLVDLLILLTS